MSDERVRLLERRLMATPSDTGALVSLALERDRRGDLTPGQARLLAWCQVPVFEVLLPAIRRDLALYAALGGSVDDPGQRHARWLAELQRSNAAQDRMHAAGLSRGELEVLGWLEDR